jgi:hypothetical protein
VVAKQSEVGSVDAQAIDLPWYGKRTDPDDEHNCPDLFFGSQPCARLPTPDGRQVLGERLSERALCVVRCALHLAGLMQIAKAAYGLKANDPDKEEITPIIAARLMNDFALAPKGSAGGSWPSRASNGGATASRRAKGKVYMRELLSFG